VRLERQHVGRPPKQLAEQANNKLPNGQKISFSAHTLRHTFLRRVTERHGVQFAIEAAGHASSKYIWRPEYLTFVPKRW
jgi:integrase/recombinase XerD